MPLALCPNAHEKHDIEPSQVQPLERENECNSLGERVLQALQQTGHSALRDADMSLRDGVIYLEGSVTSYYQKQLAQEAVRHVFGEKIFRNNLEVKVQWKPS